MTRCLTNVAQTEPFAIQDAARAVRFDYFMLKDFLGPIILFDHVHMRSAGFPPHPHAGLCVFSYLLEDSKGSLRDRDSINRELLVEPGDLLWFQMASGLIHEENPAVDGVEINQMQVWVNLISEKQGLEPATFHLKAADVPVTVDAGGNRARVVLGDYRGVSSPLAVTEPFTLLDIRLAGKAAIDVPTGWSGIVYVLSGEIAVEAGGKRKTLNPGQVVGVGEGCGATLEGTGAHALYMARPLLDQPLALQGMYAMTSQDDIDRAKRRFHAGEFGHVEPYAKMLRPDVSYIPAGQDPDLTVKAVVERQATVRHYDEGWWKLHFQYCRFEYSDYETAWGYRFVWEDPDGAEKPYRTGGYIPYMEYVAQLLAAATREGWGNLPYRDSF